MTHAISSAKTSVIVTGVSSGIGEAIARHFIEKGYRVFGSVRKEADADRLQQALGDLFVPLVFDVRDRPAIER